MKIVIDIPEQALDVLKNEGVDWLDAEHILDAVSKGIPYEEKHQGKWIPVNERLPEVYGEYLITDLHGDVRKDTYNDYFKNFNAGKHVVAWMPLPEPYTENNYDTSGT